MFYNNFIGHNRNGIRISSLLQTSWCQRNRPYSSFILCQLSSANRTRQSSTTTCVKKWASGCDVFLFFLSQKKDTIGIVRLVSCQNWEQVNRYQSTYSTYYTVVKLCITQSHLFYIQSDSEEETFKTDKIS